jgi:hypothetical protein
MMFNTGRGRGHDKHHAYGNLNRMLTNDELQAHAPSIFASRPIAGVSENYAFIPTIQAVEGLKEAGWVPVWVSEQKVRLERRLGFQKHMIRFQRRDQVGKETEFCPEVCLVNSHDRSSAYQIHAGIFRFICGNGMIVADSTFERVSIRHSRFDPDQIIEASCRVLESVPQLAESVATFKARQLSPVESRAFAESALILRYDALKTSPVSPQKLLEPRRNEDQGTSLWHTFNRVQENVMQGGLKDYSRRKQDGKRFPKTRGVSGLDQNISLNKALWHLAEALNEKG